MNPIPNPITINTGEQERVSETIDDFFIETKEFCQRKYDLQESDFQIRSGELAYHHSQITDDGVTYLLCKDMILAGVFETRTESNYVRYTFFRNLRGFEKLARKR